MQDMAPEEHPHFHDTEKLLQNYRDVVWSLELSVEQARNRFFIEQGKNIDEFLDDMYAAGADIGGSKLESRAKSLEKSKMMLDAIDSEVELMRTKHKHGETCYWILFYTYLCPQQLDSVEEILEKLQPHFKSISRQTYYRRRPEAIAVLSSILWGFTARGCLGLVDQLI